MGFLMGSNIFHGFGFGFGTAKPDGFRPVAIPNREQVCEDQYHEPEPEGQYLQDFPKGFANGKFNLIL